MKFTCLQENLAKGLSTISKAVPTKSTLPILSNVLISASKGRLKLSATNLDTSITTFVGASIEEEGSIAVPAKLVRDFVSTLSPSTVVVHMAEHILHITSDKAQTKFNGTPPDDYPDVPELAKDMSFVEVDPTLFAHSIGSVAFAAASDDSQPIFSGVLLQFVDGTLILAASDGFRLSEKNLPFQGSMEDFSVVVPAKVLLEVGRIFASSAEPIKIALDQSENLVLFESEDTSVVARILEGQFPDYKKIIPTDAVLKTTIVASEFLEAVKLANIFAKDATSAITVAFDPSGFISLSSTSHEMGEHTSKFEANVEGEGLSVTFNSKYLLDFLNNTKLESLILETKASAAPCLLKSPDHADFLHIIMPMQVQN